MALVAPRGRKHLSADALFRTVRSGFAAIPDYRLSDTEISLTDALMSAFALFSLKSPSLLAFDKHRVEGNLGTIYAIDHVPCDTQMREILDPVSPESLRPLFKSVFGQLQRGKALESMLFLDDYYFWPSMGRSIFPPRRCIAPPVSTRSTATGRSRITTKCWVRRWSIRTSGL